MVSDASKSLRKLKRKCFRHDLVISVLFYLFHKRSIYPLLDWWQWRDHQQRIIDCFETTFSYDVRVCFAAARWPFCLFASGAIFFSRGVDGGRQRSPSVNPRCRRRRRRPSSAQMRPLQRWTTDSAADYNSWPEYASFHSSSFSFRPSSPRCAVQRRFAARASHSLVYRRRPLTHRLDRDSLDLRISYWQYTPSLRKDCRLACLFFYNLKKLEPIFTISGSLYPNAPSFKHSLQETSLSTSPHIYLPYFAVYLDSRKWRVLTSL